MRLNRISIALLVLIVAASVWAGLILGVSFIATPAKFLAPSLTLPVALDVGRHTFQVFSRIEIGCALALAALAVFAGRWSWIVLACVLVGVVAAEVRWLLPALDARVAAIIVGEMPPPSRLHAAYVTLEAAKLVILAALVFMSALILRRRLAQPS